MIQKRLDRANRLSFLLSLALGGAITVALYVAFLRFLPASILTYEVSYMPVFGLLAFAVSGVAGLAAFVALLFATELTANPEEEKEQHIYVRHKRSGECGYFPPGKRPHIPFRNLVFIVIPFDYTYQTVTQECLIPATNLKLTAIFAWRPHLPDLRAWIEGDREKTAVYARRECVRAAHEAAARILAERVAEPGDVPLASWSEQLFQRLEARGREKWDTLLDRELPFNPPQLPGKGIEVAQCRFVLTRIPEPEPEPQEAWETYEELHIGNHDKQPVFLTDADRIAHVQIIGASRLGKSKLVEYAIRQFIFNCEGVCVIDPNQQLYDDILTWCVHRGLGDETIHFLDPSDARSTIGFNPFRLEGKRTPDRIAARANRLLGTTLKSLGMNGDTAIQARRIIRCLYYVLLEQDLPITELKAFLSPRLFDRRDEIMARCQSEDIRDQWAMLTEGKTAPAYVAMMQSSANRLFDLIAEPGVQRLMTNPHPVSLREITAKSDILIVNLGKSDIFSITARNVIGTFLVDEIWDVMSSRTKQQVEDIDDFNFVVDEFHNFATPEFAEMLKEGAKYKLHLWLINHNLDDLERSVRSALNACHTRIAFGGTAPKDAAFIMEGSRPSSRRSELKNEIAAIPSLKKRVFALRRTGERNVFCVTPWVESFPVTGKAKQSYLDDWTRMPKIEAEPILTEREPAKAPAPKAIPTPKKPREVDSDDFYH